MNSKKTLIILLIIVIGGIINYCLKAYVYPYKAKHDKAVEDLKIVENIIQYKEEQELVAQDAPSTVKNGIDWGSYLKQIQQDVNSNLEFTNNGSTGTLSSNVKFFIFKDGTITDIVISQPSGNNEFDYSIVAAVKKTVPFRAFPEGFDGKGINVELNFQYRTDLK